MSIVFGLAWRRQITEQNETGVEVVSWYWHFVDGVWAVVFTLVYFVGRWSEHRETASMTSSITAHRILQRPPVREARSSSTGAIGAIAESARIRRCRDRGDAAVDGLADRAGAGDHRAGRRPGDEPGPVRRRCGALRLRPGGLDWPTAARPGPPARADGRAGAAVPGAVAGKAGMVDQLRPGVAGYRFQLPEKIHPISAGVKGGIVGGLVMPIPALAYGLLSGHGLWFPINLLAGMAVPGISGETAAPARAVLRGVADPGDLHPCHVLGDVRAALRGRLADLAADPGRSGGRGRRADAALLDGHLLRLHGDRQSVARIDFVNWPWFIASQVVYGVAMSIVVINSEKVPRRTGGERAGPVGGCPRSPARLEVRREFPGHLRWLRPATLLGP